MPSNEHHFACRLTWTGAAQGPTTSRGDYGRDFRVEIAGKPPIEGSSAPAFRGDPARLNSEDLLVAALCSCHCLSYLSLAARAGIAVVGYEDDAIGTMKSVDDKIRVTEVTLRPTHRGHSVCTKSDELANVINIGKIVLGSFQSGYLGYYAFEPRAGHGYLAKGLCLVMALAFRRYGLHRLEANIQPENQRSL